MNLFSILFNKKGWSFVEEKEKAMLRFRSRRHLRQRKLDKTLWITFFSAPSKIKFRKIV